MAYEGPEAEVRALRERAQGQARQGIVTLRDFHQGVVETLLPELIALNGKPNNKHYFLKVPGIDLTDAGLPGVPIYFSYPEDVFEKYKIPLVMVKFDGLSAAMQRWHPGMGTYRVPARSAVKVSSLPVGYTAYETQQQAAPFDLNYTLVIEARHRGTPGGQRTQVLSILRYVQGFYQPFTEVWVRDSVGDLRNYYAETSDATPEDEVFDVADRTIGFSLPLRVEGELDLNPAQDVPAVTQSPVINTAVR